MAPAPAIEPLQQILQRAGEASLQGSKDRARELYTSAARTYPTSKEPWLKLAQDHFETRNYGQAILAAQEVLLRDPSDGVATSILAVSGLRVSAAGLSAMRQQQSRLNGDTRSEAEDIVRKLRELLGEPVLVPATTGVATGASGPASAARSRLARTRAVPATSKPAAAVAPAAPAPQKGGAPANPFNVLTK
ncbi:MAG: hypothetical protein ABI281_04015 [Caldimonas sp.]